MALDGGGAAGRRWKAEAMSTERATWSYTYEKGLVDVMKGLANLPMLKGQNGWTAEGWRNITKQFNDMFLNAHFTKQQIQEKEKELKASYKVIRDARKSGVGWNNSLGMIIAEPNIWKKLIDDNSKVAKFRKKAFPLYDSLESLHEGNIATGDLNFTSTEILPPRIDMQVHFSLPPQRTKTQAVPRVESTPQRSTSEQSIHNTVPIANPFRSGFDGIESTEAQSAPSSLNSEDQDVTGGKKRKQSQMATKLGDYIDYRKSQTEETLKKLDEKKRLEAEYSVGKCIDAVDAMQDLTDEDKADANELFQSEMNRQIFMKTKNPNVRRIWLKKKISKMGSNV